tara:strand:+ start:2526 stop:3662 length:1137 start_codon:yes stop_codon:yes gene_type:complete
MKFETTRNEALKKLDNFINNEIVDYNFKRNFDYGPNQRKNVSCLSPYVSHRLITEYEIVKKVLKKHLYQKVDKYIQEVFWRVYWKGWLELRPKVWTDFVEDLNSIKEDERLLNAKNGKTQIECFNNWVSELKQFNYLHNHTRMWFASIWIFTLKLPWQKGAEFFMQYLYDGDAASNTLSWRWVAGLQTKGKNYSAQSWNISKFTNNKYKNIKLIENAKPLFDSREYKITPLSFSYKDNSNENLIFFENDLNIETIDLKKYKKIYCVIIENSSRIIKLDEKVLKFKKKIIEDQKARFDKIEIIDETKFQNILQSVKSFDLIYPCIGENMSFIKRLSKKNNLNFSLILRNEDIYSWQFSNKGYFNFKSNLPKILSKFKMN